MIPNAKPLIYPDYLPPAGSLSDPDGDILDLGIRDLWDRIPMEEGPITSSEMQPGRIYKGRLSTGAFGNGPSNGPYSSGIPISGSHWANPMNGTGPDVVTLRDALQKLLAVRNDYFDSAMNNFWGGFVDWQNGFIYGLWNVYYNIYNDAPKDGEFNAAYFNNAVLYGLDSPEDTVPKIDSEVMIFKMSISDANVNLTRCLTPLPSTICLQDRILQSTPEVCLGVGMLTSSSIGSQCQTWWGSIPDDSGITNKNSEIEKLYNLYPDISAMSCSNRFNNPDFLQMKGVAPLSSTSDQCWYRPCSLEGYDRLVVPELANSRGECSTDFCGTIVNVVDSTNLNIEDFENYVNCSASDYDSTEPGDGGNTGGGGGNNTDTENNSESKLGLIGVFIIILLVLFFVLVFVIYKRTKNVG